MQFLREDQQSAVQAIATNICDGLFAGARVLWLTSGGSNVAAEVAVMDMLRTHASENLDGLAILPMDERYGKPGHADSNTEQLRAAGFNPGAATWVDILMHDLPFDQTLSFYNGVAAAAIANAGIIIGQFGLGSDGHTAGILPGSPATEIDEATVIGYEWSDYTRLTLSASALAQVQAAFVLAYGSGKKAAINRLKKNVEPFADLPSVLLYEIADTHIYNDQLTS
jgi:6-phosphogluconolactonase/glucosamine-6-phosphate isomerase/deaminase